MITTTRALALLLAALCVAPGAALAAPAATDADADAVARLERMLAEARTVQAAFDQVLLDDQLEVVKESRGRFALQRPGRFRWDYEAPSAQTIVSDGSKLWVHDHELEQVTVKALDAALATSPAALLGGKGALSDSFDIVVIAGDAGGMRWLELVPKVDDAEFDKVRLGLGPRFIEVMELTDPFGQVTRITLREVEVNGKLPKGAFEFVPPPGADVVGLPDAGR